MKKYLLALCIILVNSFTVKAQKSLKFVIRVDDILSRNTNILPRSIVPFQEVVESRVGKITWGVMPHRFIETSNLDGKLAQELKESAEKGNELSMHGWEHVCQRCGLSSHEFYCTTHNTPFTLEQQEKLIQDGIDLMIEKTGVKPVSFIPPGHVSDDVTLRALLNKGIKKISTTKPAINVLEDLFNVGMDDEYTWALTPAIYEKNLHDALAEIRIKAEEKGYYVLMMHDPFIRSGYENGITLKWTAELLDSLKIEYGENFEINTVSEIIDFVQLQQTSIEDQNFTQANEFDLFANYPNPFNPSTEIQFSLARTNHVSLSVYNIQGKLVETLIDGVQKAGIQTITWNAENFPSGMYLYRLIVNGSSETQKMTLIK